MVIGRNPGWKLLVVILVLLAATLGPLGGDYAAAGDFSTLGMGDAVPDGDDRRVLSSTRVFGWQNMQDNCEATAEWTVNWVVDGSTPDAVDIDRIELDFTPNTSGAFTQYILRFDSDEVYVGGFQGETQAGRTISRTINVREDIQSQIGGPIPWLNDAISLEVRFTGERLPDDVGAPCGILENGIQIALFRETVDRLAGPERISTAVNISRDIWAEQSARSATLALDVNFPDALAGTPRAVAGDGPTLLTRADELPGDTAAEIQRVLPPGRPVQILGGTAAVSEDVAAQVRALGYPVDRLSGLNRFATAVAIADDVDRDPSRIYVADGETFEYAITAGTAAAVDAGVLVLTAGSRLPPETEVYLDAHPSAQILAVGEAAVAALEGTRTITEVAGEDQYETSVLLAQQLGADTVGVASGEVFADGLTGGAHIARSGSPLVLSPRGRMTSGVADFLTDRAPARTVFFGGTAALSTDVAMDAMGLVEWIP